MLDSKKPKQRLDAAIHFMDQVVRIIWTRAVPIVVGLLTVGILLLASWSVVSTLGWNTDQWAGGGAWLSGVGTLMAVGFAYWQNGQQRDRYQDEVGRLESQHQRELDEQGNRHNEQLQLQREHHNEQLQVQREQLQTQLQAQREQLQEQLRAQREQHDEQLKAQRDHLKEQLQSQSDQHQDQRTAQEIHHASQMEAVVSEFKAGHERHNAQLREQRNLNQIGAISGLWDRVTDLVVAVADVQLLLSSYIVAQQNSKLSTEDEAAIKRIKDDLNKWPREFQPVPYRTTTGFSATMMFLDSSSTNLAARLKELEAACHKLSVVVVQSVNQVRYAGSDDFTDLRDAYHGVLRLIGPVTQAAKEDLKCPFAEDTTADLVAKLEAAQKLDQSLN